MIYDPIGYQAVWFPALYWTAGSTSTLWWLLYSHKLDALRLPWQLKFFSSRHGCSCFSFFFCFSSSFFFFSLILFLDTRSTFTFSSFHTSSFSCFLYPMFFLSLNILHFFFFFFFLIISRYARKKRVAIKTARSARTFTRSLTAGSARVKGTDVTSLSSWSRETGNYTKCRCFQATPGSLSSSWRRSTSTIAWLR